MPLWSVTIETARPDDAARLPAHRVDALERRFRLHLEADERISDVFTMVEADRVGAQFALECADPTKAVTRAVDRFEEAAAEAKLPAWPVVVMGALVEDPVLSPVVGAAEAGEMLSVSRQRLAQLARRPDFPAAWTTLAATPVWLRTQIRRFERRWPRRSGRPPKDVAVAGASGR